MRLSELIARRRLMVCVGPGGVGKTTVAAALGLCGARAGRRTLVLTIDPARRLADALGLDGLDDKVRPVPEDRLQQALPAERIAPLYAAMLETQQSFDALIERIGADAASTERILKNPIYAAFSRTLARSHAHVAMERVYDAVEGGGFDLVILDTPPLRSALDILDAPGRLVQFLDQRIVRWFIEPERGRLSRLIPRGGAAATRLLAMIASKKLVVEATEFFRALTELEPGFRQRAERMQEILREPSTGFVLVCAPTRTSLEDAAYLSDGLKQRDVMLDAAVFNRAFIADQGSGLRVTAPRGPLSGRRVMSEAERVALGELARLRDQVVTANEAALDALERFVVALPPSAARAELPELDADIRDLAGLAGLGRWLLA